MDGSRIRQLSEMESKAERDTGWSSQEQEQSKPAWPLHIFPLPGDHPRGRSLKECIVEVKVKLKWLSRVQLFVTPWTVAYQARPFMGFYRQEYWSGLPFSSPGDLPDPGIKPGSPALQTDSLTSEPPVKPQKRV